MAQAKNTASRRIFREDGGVSIVRTSLGSYHFFTFFCAKYCGCRNKSLPLRTHLNLGLWIDLSTAEITIGHLAKEPEENITNDDDVMVYLAKMMNEIQESVE